MDKFKSGFTVMAGLPNAGKSTLLNALAGGLLSAVTHKPQTTRQNILAISEGENYQIIFVDTPGFLKPQYDLQRCMSSALDRAINEDGDLVLFIYDHTQGLKAHEALIKKLKGVLCPVILVSDKTDIIKDKDGLAAAEEFLAKELKTVKTLRISAAKRDGLAELKEAVIALLPYSPPYFEKGQWTDRWERFYAAEFIREQIFILFDKEVPYCS
jgi:GTP-binding protein Era